MHLGRQWDQRLKIWDEAFTPNLYRKTDRVELEGFISMPVGIKRVWKCNMLEEKQCQIASKGGKVELKFHAFEIITLLLET